MGRRTSLYYFTQLNFGRLLKKKITVLYSPCKGDEIMAKFTKDLTKGNVWTQLIMFAVPFFISNLIQSVYGLADMMILGNYCGSESISAVNTSSQIAIIVTNLAMGFSTGGTVMIGQYLGAGRSERIKSVIGTLLISLGVLAVVLSAGLIVFADPILSALNVPKEAFADAKIYLLVNAAGLVFVFGYNALSAIMRGMGDSKTPLIFVTIACFLNIALDFLFVGYFGFGTGGAAVATIFSQAVSMFLCMAYLKRNDFVFDFKLSSFTFSKSEFALLIKVGLPTGIQHVATNFSFLLLTGIINDIGGVAAGAASGIVSKFNGFSILPDIAISTSVSAMISQNMGARKEDRIKKATFYGLFLCCCISWSIFAVANIFPKQIFMLFGTDKELMDIGLIYMKAFSFEYIFVPFIISLNAVFTGTGNGWVTLITNTITSFAVRLPLAIYLGRVIGLGVSGVGYSIPAATLAGSLIAFIFYLSGIWKRNVVIKESQ